MTENNITFSDGVNRMEAGFVTLVVAFAITLTFGFYKAITDGDFPPNVTSFLTTLALTIGAVEVLPKTPMFRK